MAKITLNPITGSYASVVALNSRFQQIEDAFNANVLWRAGSTGEPNSMAVDLDMADNDILNVDYLEVTDLFATTLTLGGVITGTNSLTLEGLSSSQFLRSDIADTAVGPITSTNGFIGDIAVPTGGLSINSVAVSKSASEINTSLYLPDAASPAIANVATRASKYLGFDALGDLTYTVGAGATTAVNVSIADAGGYYTGTEVETALQEVGAELTSLQATTKIFATLSVAQNIPTSTNTTVEFDTVVFDTLSELDLITNVGRVIPTVAGYYQVNASMNLNEAFTIGDNMSFKLYKSLTVVASISNTIQASGTLLIGESLSALVFCNGTTDYIRAVVSHNAGAGIDLLVDNSFLSVTRVL